MKKNIFFLSLTMAAALLAASCSKDDAGTVPATGITITPETLELPEGTSETLIAIVLPDNADKTVSWKSNKPTVVAVDNGTVTALKIGSATVTAVTANGLKATCVVTVTQAPLSGLIIIPDALSIAEGNTAPLTVVFTPENPLDKGLTWATNAPAVATVNNGAVTGVSAGTALITATSTADHSKTAVCTVTVSAGVILTLAGYSGTVATLTYTDNTTEVLTVTNHAAPFVHSEKTIKSITPDGGAAILIGRKANSSFTLKFAGTSLAFRDAVSGFVPIGSYAEFQLINGNLSGSYKQDADIDLMSQLWTPIGASGGLTGTFDGAGYTLANIYVNSTSGEGKGLFGWATNATFKNVWLVSGTVTSTQSVTGGICGGSYGCTFLACHNSATVNGASNSTGGICGFSSSLFIACSNSGAINTTGQYAGGIVAYCRDEVAFQGGVIACYNTGAVTGTSANPFNMGGIAGYLSGTKGVVACYNTGLVTSPATSVGALVGLNSSTVQYNYWNTTNANAIGTGEGTATDNAKFSDTAWPSASANAEWGTGDGSGSGKYWKSLGSWNGGSPIYPKLFFE